MYKFCRVREHCLIKGTGAPTLKFLLRVVQQFRTLPRVDTKINFLIS